MARAARLQTQEPTGLERRRARRTGRRDATVNPNARSPQIARHRADVRTVENRTHEATIKTAGAANRQAHRREDARRERQRRDEERVQLEPARLAAGSAVRAYSEWLTIHAAFSLFALLDIAGGMIVMQRITIPLGLPPNAVRSLGALALGFAAMYLPILAARTLAAPAAETAAERRAAAARRTHDVGRAVTLLALALAIVAVVAFARYTTPALKQDVGVGSIALPIQPLLWWELAMLGVVVTAITFTLALYLDARAGALRAHWLVLCNRAHALRANVVRQQAERQLESLARQWVQLCASEETDLRALGVRHRRLHDEWSAGAAGLLHDPQPTPVLTDEVRPALFAENLDGVARETAEELEAAAAHILRDVDPFILVLPRRQPPNVLIATRRMLGIEQSRHA